MTLVFSLLGIYLVFGASLFLMQRWLIYPVPREVVTPNLREARLHRIAVANGVTAFALHVKAKKNAPTIAHFHGNAEQLADQEQLAQWFGESGIGFFAVEYPGYGLAKAGTPNERNIYRTAEAALKYLNHDLKVPAHRTVLQGQSLGTGVAVEMARRGFGVRLSLISPYTSMADMAATVAPLYPVKWLVLDRYDNALKAPALELPVLIIHGSDDEVVPFRMGKRLAKTFPKAELQIVKGAHHNDLFWVGGGNLIKRIVEFSFGGNDSS
jgi:fermentation-respiration switch protein FrsA (DUF1100 family)